MTKDQFEAAASASPDSAKQLKSLYTLVTRPAGGGLVAAPYHDAFAPQLKAAAAKLREAAKLADDPGLRKYLGLRAQALLTDDFKASDMAWLDMKTNTVDVVIGPIETYEDALFGYKAAYEAYVLVKDKEWSKRLARYAALLPGLQTGLPVADEYKREKPGTDSDLNAYDVLFYAGDSNAGSKTIAINLPNDEEIQLKKGTRRLQLKNAMRAKFDKILVPIANVLIAEDQRSRIKFDAFFADTMFHEVAHGLGIKKTLTGKGMVRQAMKDQASALEEGKADILGLYMITKLMEQGEYKDIGAARQLRHLPGRHLPLDPLRRRQRARRGQPGALQLLREGRRIHPRREDRHVPRQRRRHEERGGRSLGEDHPSAGRWRLRWSAAPGG